jgi:site-specific recombinase XerD
VEGKSKGGPMDTSYLRRKIKMYAEEAGITKRVHPHGLRHTMTVDALRDGVPLHLVSRQLRHANLATTATYAAGISGQDVVDAFAARPAVVA